MSLTTRSIFYFNFDVTSSNNILNFSEGGGELTATIDVGSFTLDTILTPIKTALDAAGAETYTVTADRTTRLITISATGVFELLVSSGSSASSIFSLIGFTGADRTGSSSYEGDSATGTTYEPQFILQSFIDSSNLQESIDSSLNESASGKIENVSFGTRSFTEMNIMFITDIEQPGIGPIINNASGEADARTFLQFITQKKPFEFMKDISTRGSFERLVVESTPFSRNGTGYRLEEMIGRNLPGYFETGVMRMRIAI